MKNLINMLETRTDLSAENLMLDSRQVKCGDIFVAVKGMQYDGHDYIPEAIEKGAALIVCEDVSGKISDSDKEKILKVEDSRSVLGDIAKKLFNDPSEKMMTYGVTGTNGKTTTVFLIDSVLGKCPGGCGFVSTVFTKTRGIEIEKSSMTTPDVLTLNGHLSNMVNNGKRYAVVEISSHALDQKRVSGIDLDAAIFTNISPEHLDYHMNMDRYLRDKSLIFKNLKPDGVGVINLDDILVRTLRNLLSEGKEMITFGLSPEADIRAENIELSREGISFDLLEKNKKKANLRSPLIGEYNVYNMLGAIAALSGKGVDLEKIIEGIQQAEPVPGRLERVVSSAPFSVFVDYAHTPNALENVLSCLRTLTDRRLICVFGCGGDRDRTKRPVMGSIACEICDKVVITSDNPRTEDSFDIIYEIEKGVNNYNNYCIIDKRQEAIAESLKSAAEGDIVLIAGKGHEDYQILGEKVIHFDDREVAGDVLNSMRFGL